MAKVSEYPMPALHLEPHSAMKQVLEHHLSQLNEFHTQVKAPVTVIGHSLGGYFTLKLLEHANEKIHEAVLIHPFLKKPDLRGRLILKTVHGLNSREPIRKLVVKYRGLIELFSDELPYVTDDELQKTLRLAHLEHLTIARDETSLIISPHIREKLRVFYTHSDSWCTPEVVAQLKNQEVLVSHCIEPHGFVTEGELRTSLFKKMKKEQMFPFAPLNLN